MPTCMPCLLHQATFCFFFFLNLFLNSLTEVTSAQPTPVYGAKGINATYEAEQMQK